MADKLWQGLSKPPLSATQPPHLIDDGTRQSPRQSGVLNCYVYDLTVPSR